MVHIRRLGSVVLVASILLGVSCNKKTPTLEALTRGERLVNSRLAEYTTVSELSSFVGTRPRRCVDFSRDVKLCEWRINNHLDSWSSLATPIGTRDQINQSLKILNRTHDPADTS